jgi:uncharacterized membrane protein YhhN
MLRSLWWPLAVAAVDWAAVAGGRPWRRLEWAAKPGAMLALMAWLAWRAAPAGWPGPVEWFLAALAGSLAGDVLLMLPPRFFVGGLAAFLLAHLAYAAGFLAEGLPPAGAWLLALPVAAAAAWLFVRLRRALLARGDGGLVGPVGVYAAAISLMVVCGLATLLRAAWSGPPGWLAAGGALLFMASDSVLAWDRFVRPVRHGRLVVMVTYHLGQIGLIAGAAGRWLG